MDVELTSEQMMLRQSTRRFLEARAPLEEVRRWAEKPDGFDRELWRSERRIGPGRGQDARGQRW